METLARIRGHFLEYFRDHDHQVMTSSPLVPKNDPTLMFTNAGMVPFKNYFTGLEQPAHRRAVSVQKCVRAGGKHNDLENVGYTARHHTFFEMLGNFSFGDYFKEQAITYAWDLVHHQLGLAKDRLVVTVYHEDTEAAQLWKKIAGLPDSRIIRIATSDNFWAMGDTGPCGPCSEIFYDHGDHIAGGPPGSPDEDGDRFVEIWNLVFMQYEQLPEGRILLPKPSIDTGSGLERLAAVLQGVHNNYDIDLFKNLIAFFEDTMSVKAEGEALTSFRVMVDHLRASSFLLADGVSPSNEGRGYVLRRIMRRAMRHGYMLGVKDPVMYRLVPSLVKEMGDAYPELVRAQSLITETLKLEETRFRATLGRGLKLLEDETKVLSRGQGLSGSVAFKLYDTYGFPLDLTQDILRSQGRSVDLEGFNRSMDAQKAEARKSWVGSGANGEDVVWLEKRGSLPATEFLGYDTLQAEAQIQLILKEGAECTALHVGEEAWILLNQTPFYGESGGQMGDRGTFKTLNGAEIQIIDTQKKAEVYHVHWARVLQGSTSVHEAVSVRVDEDHRQGLQAHHSATHLLHAVLRRHLGDQVVQKGSLVAYDRMRFDFSYPQGLSKKQLRAFEQDVNRLIRANSLATTRLMAPEDALQTGAMALFGEKYGEEVRVISMGGEEDQRAYSVEFCGGTHVERTGDIGFFKIVSESGVAAGIRRIEAFAGLAAEGYVQTMVEHLSCMADLLKTPAERLSERLEALLDERKILEKENRSLQQKVATGTGAAESFETIGSVKMVQKWFEDMPPKELKGIAETLGKQTPLCVLVAGTGYEDKASVVVYVSSELTPRISAVDLVKVAAKALGGQGGGGRPDMAQAGGPNAHNWNKALEDIKEMLKKI